MGTARIESPSRWQRADRQGKARDSHSHSHANMPIRSFPAALFGLSVVAAAARGQQPTQFGPEVRPVISVERGTVALVHVRVLDGTGREAKSDQTVLLVGNRIQAVGPAAEVKIPSGAKVMNLPGHTVIPGLIGLHDHMFYTTPQQA